MISEQEIKGIITTQELKGELGKTIEIIPPMTQEKTCTPTEAVQEIVPDEDYTGLSKVTVSAIPEQYVVPSGTQNITANGQYDIKLKETVNVSVGETPKNVVEINTAVHSIWQDYCAYLDETNEQKEAYTTDPVTFYTPASDFTKYYIIYYPSYNTYTVFWKKQENMYVDIPRNRLTGWTFETSYDYQQVYRNNSNEWYIYNEHTRNTKDNGYQREIYMKSNIATLEEAINCLKDPNTEYYHNTRWTINVNTTQNFYTNDTLFVYEDNVLVVCDLPCISHNETIEVISSE